jgi:hypothetical protein
MSKGINSGNFESKGNIPGRIITNCLNTAPLNALKSGKRSKFVGLYCEVNSAISRTSPGAPLQVNKIHHKDSLQNPADLFISLSTL